MSSCRRPSSLLTTSDSFRRGIERPGAGALGRATGMRMRFVIIEMVAENGVDGQCRPQSTQSINVRLCFGPTDRAGRRRRRTGEQSALWRAVNHLGREEIGYIKTISRSLQLYMTARAAPGGVRVAAESVRRKSKPSPKENDDHSTAAGSSAGGMCAKTLFGQPKRWSVGPFAVLSVRCRQRGAGSSAARLRFRASYFNHFFAFNCIQRPVVWLGI